MSKQTPSRVPPPEMTFGFGPLAVAGPTGSVVFMGLAGLGTVLILAYMAYQDE